MPLPADETLRRLWIDAWLAGAAAGWRAVIMALLAEGAPGLQESDASAAFDARKG